MQIDSQSQDRFSSTTHKPCRHNRWSRLPQELLRARTFVAIFSLLLAGFANQAHALAQGPPSMPPSAQDDWEMTNYDQEVFIDATMNDHGLSAPLDLTTVQITMQPFFGTVTVDSVTGVIAYVPDGDYTGQDWFQYSVKDTLGQESNSASVTIDLFNIPPTISDFEVLPGPVDTWTFRGKVWDENPEEMTVQLTGIVDVPAVTVEFDGSFSITVFLNDPSDFGTVFADTVDEVGGPSNTAMTTAGYYN